MASSSEYQANYYQLNVDELRLKARERARKKRAKTRAHEEMSRIAQQAHMQVTTRKSIITSTKPILSLLVLGCVTFLLIHEMITFYVQTGSYLLAFIKAVAMEGSVLLLSATTHKKAFNRIVYRSLAILICIFSTYAMCSKHYSQALESVTASKTLHSQMDSLQILIQEKRSQRDKLFDQGWITAARKLDKTIDEFSMKLEATQNLAMALKPPEATKLNALAEMGFRVLLMAISIILSSRVGEELKQFGTSKQIMRIPSSKLENYLSILKFQNMKNPCS